MDRCQQSSLRAFDLLASFVVLTTIRSDGQNVPFECSSHDTQFPRDSFDVKLLPENDLRVSRLGSRDTVPDGKRFLARQMLYWFDRKRVLERGDSTRG